MLYGGNREVEEDDEDEGNPRPYLIEIKESSSESTEVCLKERDKGRYSFKKFSSFWMFPLTMFWLTVIPLILWFFHQTPHTYLRHEEVENMEKFQGYKAENFVKEYTSLGSRWFAHYEFWHAHEYLRNRIDEILKGHDSEDLEFEVDIDSITGSFHKENVLYYFRDFTNIALKLYPKGNGTYPTLLLSTCYDSYYASPGATEATNIGVFLELIRIFVLMNPSITASYNATLIFLFVGARYNHRTTVVHFTQTHRWSTNIS